MNFLGPKTTHWGGRLPPEGVGVEKLVPSLENSFPPIKTQRSATFSPGCPENFAWMPRTPGDVQRVCAKNICAHCSVPQKKNFADFLFWFFRLSCLNVHSSTPTPVFLTSRKETQTMVRAKLGPKLRPPQTLYLPGKDTHIVSEEVSALILQKLMT